MKNQPNRTIQLELKKEIKKSFDSMLDQVVKGKISIQDFTKQVNYNYAQKRMELSGSIF